MFDVVFNYQTYNVSIWNGEELGTYVAIDTETTVREFTDTPDLVTFQAFDGKAAYYVRPSDLKTFFLVNRYCKFIAHNFAFDCDVICKVMGDPNYFHNMLENNQIMDTGILYKLWRLGAHGFIPKKGWSLDAIVKEFLNMELAKIEDIRMGFGRFLGASPEQLPREYLEYGILDVIATYQIFTILIKRVDYVGGGTMLTHQIQIAASIALNRIYKRGIGFDPEAAEKLLSTLQKEVDTQLEILATWGYVPGMVGIMDTFDRIINYLGITDIPRTDDGKHYKHAGEDLEPYKDLPFIDVYCKYIDLKKTMDVITPHIGKTRVHPRYDLLKDTGRTGCSNPNFQNLPRKGGVRELFIPKPGHKFIDVDYYALEIASLAQVLFTKYKSTEMMDAYNSGECVHKMSASAIYKKPVKDITKDERQFAKILNFGLPANMGAATFVEYAKGYGVSLTNEDSAKLKDDWSKAFPGIQKYWKDGPGMGETKTVWTLTGRARANTRYTACMNTPFQGLAADGAKLALYYLDVAGFQTVGFVHDQVVIEHPIEGIEEAKQKVEAIMIDAMKAVCPDLNIRVDGNIIDRFCKG